MTREPPRPQAAPRFLAGGGEMGALIRAHDWTATPLGPTDDWPQSLRTALGIMLTSRQPIWIGWGEDLTYFYNDAYKSIIGGRHPWALGRPTQEVWREIWPEIGPMLATAMGGVEGIYEEEKLLIMERNGYPEETYYTFSYSPIPGDDGGTGGIICANTEDTERVVNERQLKLLRELAARTADARTWADACERSVHALATDAHDVTFALLYEVAPAAQTARLVAKAGLPDGHAAAPVDAPLDHDAPWPFAQVLQSNQPHTAPDLAALFPGGMPNGAWDSPPQQAAILPVATPGDAGRAGMLVVGLNPYRLFDGGYRGFLQLAAGQIAAAGANAEAYEEERRRAEALAELDRAKTAFFSNVSHEFRTPLTLMLGPLEDALAGHGDAEALRDQIALAHRNGARLLRLVNSLLDFSRIEAGRSQASLAPVDLCQASTDIASSFRSAFDRAGLTLKTECSALSQPVYLDQEMWEKILLNLISNAFKFTLEGSVTVSVDEDAATRQAVVRVADTGIGIPEAELPKLFDRFHRVEGAQGRSFEGSGIGLALVSELVRLHGWSIDVESALGRGTTFTVRMPLGHAHLTPDRLLSEAAPPVGPVREAYLEEALGWLPEVEQRLEAEGQVAASGLAAITADPSRPGAGKRILLADDNADMRGYVSRLLEAQGYAVDAVEDGQAALDHARASRPDLVLTDVMMPNLDGFGLLRALRSEEASAGVPVIMLSARAGEEAKVEGLQAGADDYLIKPFAARELAARVNANIQLAEFRREADRVLWRSEQRFRISQDRLAMALSTGQVGVYEWAVDSDQVAVLGPLAQLYGVDTDEAAEGVLPIGTFLAGIHPDDRERVADAINRAMADRAPLEAEYRLVGSGQERTVLVRGVTRDAPNGGALLTGAIIDITEVRASERALQEQTRALRILNRAAAAVSGDLDQERLVQTIVDAAVEVTGAEFGAFFYNLINEAGESYTLYTLSGAPREAFARFPMPRNTPVFEPTFVGTGVIRSADITADPRYGTMSPHYGMPKGHLPVRSYLAAPVKSRDGQVIGGLFFGHSEPERFDALSEDRVVGLASQAAVALDNAKLFQAAQWELGRRRRVEEQLQSLNAGLEERVATEVAERAKAEDALRQAQKMEAVGQLTGGVAHDFNNLLTVIIGGLDTIRRSRPEEEGRVQRATAMALQGAERAAALTARLLAFSRRQPLEPKALDLNQMIRDMSDLLHRSLGEQVEMEGVLAPRLWTVEADPNQLETAVLNLAVNARDSMPEGGKLTIETFNTALDESYTAVDSEVIPGQYAVIAVSDTGAGMSKDTVARAFEPFFTTKEVGKGTGLGLSMVYGFVKQSGGHVTLYSEPGQGTTVKLYFPRFHGSATTDDPVADIALPTASDAEAILVVEDNDDVRAYSTMILGDLGYRVLEAADADAALAILRSDQPVDLLFTDVILPGKSGRVLADAAAELRPGLKVLYTTGYSRNAIVHHGRLDPGVQLITKPFTFEQLAVRVRDLLDQPPGEPRP